MVMDYNKPLPVTSADTKDFWEGCREHELRMQKCSSCGQLRWPPAYLCPHCLSHGTEWIKTSGRGAIYSYIVYHIAYDPAFKHDLPYVVALVKLEEGPHLLTNIVGCDPGKISCDMAVEVIWDDINETFSLPKFNPMDTVV